MNLPIRKLWSLVALVALLPLGGCLFRTRPVERRQIAGNLKEATLEQLVERINAEAEKVSTMNATVDIAASSGGEKKGNVTEYSEIRGYVLVRKPQMLRMIGLFPVVRNRMFDMVSDGESFRMSVPARNRFIVGRNDVIRANPKQPIENLRPQHIFDALLLREIDPKHEVAVVEATSEMMLDAKSKKKVETPSYAVVVVRRAPEGSWYLSRKIVFTRDDLQPHRQIVYDRMGNIATDARYDDFQIYGNLLFPSVISIFRPQEEYTVQLKIVKLTLNDPLRDEQFELPQPPGSQLVRMDQPMPSAGSPTASNPQASNKQ